MEFYWGKPQEEALTKVKEIITQEPGQVFTYYDPAKLSDVQNKVCVCYLLNQWIDFNHYLE